MCVCLSVSSGFGRCMVIRKHQTSLRKYANGAADNLRGPPAEDGDTIRKDPR